MGAQTDILPPRYRDAELIGRGGMGDIYRARDETLGRTVVVKVLADRYAADEDVRRRFKHEALAAARLSGEPGIVTIFDVGEWDERPFIVMEYLRGGSLEEVLRERGRVPPDRALAWLEDAGRAIDAAHAHGVVHRDVKPGNLLLDGNGEVHVADFGIANAAGLDSLTRTGTVLGTVGYLSPEQARGERSAAASDRYALAVVAFELLAGERPFESGSATAEALGHVQAPVPAISERAGHLPAELDSVFERALAKDPDERYATAADFVGALRDAFAAAAGTTERRAAPVVSPAQPATEPTKRAAGLGTGAAAPRRRPLVPLVLVGLLALGLGGIALASLVAGRGEEAAPERERQRTIVRTLTTEGEERTVPVTVTQTVEEEEPPPAATTAAPPPPPAVDASGAQLNNQAFALMGQGRYDEALPLLEQALTKLRGSGSLDEAYTLYNLAFTRLQLGNCEGVLAMLDQSEGIQGERKEIDRARRQAERQCGDGDDGDD